MTKEKSLIEKVVIEDNRCDTDRGTFGDIDKYFEYEDVKEAIKKLNLARNKLRHNEITIQEYFDIEDKIFGDFENE